MPLLRSSILLHCKASLQNNNVVPSVNASSPKGPSTRTPTRASRISRKRFGLKDWKNNKSALTSALCCRIASSTQVLRLGTIKTVFLPFEVADAPVSSRFSKSTTERFFVTGVLVTSNIAKCAVQRRLNCDWMLRGRPLISFEGVNEACLKHGCSLGRPSSAALSTEDIKTARLVDRC